MKPKRSRIVIGVLLSVAIGVVILSRNDEPQFQGKSLSEWLIVYQEQSKARDNEFERARSAVGVMGVDAIPTLTRWIEEYHQPSPALSWVYRKAERFPLIGMRVIPYLNAEDEERRKRSKLAVCGFEILGPVAAPAVPQLVKHAKSPHGSMFYYDSIAALGKIGPLALPGLFQVATNCQTEAGRGAFGVINRFGTNLTPIRPSLVQCLTNNYSPLAAHAAAALGYSNSERSLAIPICLRLLQDPDATARESAVWAILIYRETSWPVLAALKNASHDPDSVVASTAAMALSQLLTLPMPPARTRWLLQ